MDKDAFHTKGNQISQVMTNIGSDDGSINTWDGTGYPVAEALMEQLPEIETAVRRTGPRGGLLKIGEKSIEMQLLGSDAGFFELFSFPLKEGEPKTCLNDIKSIVLSEEMATIYFPDGAVLGKTIDLMLSETSEPYLVTGVFKKIPRQSTLKFDAVVPVDNFLPMNNKSWGNTWVKTFVLHEEGANLNLLGQKLQHLPEQMGDDKWRTLSLQPFNDRYLYSKFENGQVIGGRIDDIILFAIIAIFTLLIACFNFINLTTALAVKRSKEVGVKKILGASRGTLLVQFLMESAVLVGISVVFAVLLAVVSMPMFNAITEKELTIDFLDGQIYGILALISLATILFSGLYPAFSLSSFKGGVHALNEQLKGNRGENFLRKGLVVFQFFLCMVMITGTMVVYLQLQYIQDRNLGLDKENIVYMPMNHETYLKSKTFKAELANFSGIKELSSASSNFIDSWGTTSDPVWEGQSPDDGEQWFTILTTDFGLMEMLNIPIKEGRSFSPEFAGDTLNYLVNEEAVKAMGMKDVIGKSLSFWGDEGGQIVGVVKNFHFTSLHNPIQPMIIRCRPAEPDLVYVKTMPGRTKEAIAHMEKVHHQFSSLPFAYHFLDETIENGYKEEQKTQQLVGTFAALAIFISCLGLFGLAAFTANQRVKEIAVRKVLGASVFGLFNLLSKDFLKLVALALLIAVPVAWYYMNEWIQGFAFHVAINWWLFALAGILLLGVALTTVSFETIKAARTDPAKSLRTE